MCAGLGLNRPRNSRQTTSNNALVRPRPSDLNQLASAKPGALHGVTVRILWCLCTVMSLTGTVSLGLALPNHPLWWWLIASLASFLLGWHPVWGVAFLLAVLPIIDCSVSIGGVHHGSFHLFMMLGCSALCAGRVMSRGDQSFVVQSPIRLTPWSFSVCALWLAFGWLSWLRAPVTAWGDLSFALSSDHTGWIAAWSTFLPTAWGRDVGGAPAVAFAT